MGLPYRRRLSCDQIERIRALLLKAYWLEETPRDAKFIGILMDLFGLTNGYGEPQPLRIAT